METSRDLTSKPVRASFDRTASMIASAAAGPSGRSRKPAVALSVSGVRFLARAGTDRIAVATSGSSSAAAARGSSARSLSPGFSAWNTSCLSLGPSRPEVSNSKTWTRLPVLPASNTTTCRGSPSPPPRANIPKHTSTVTTNAAARSATDLDPLPSWWEKWPHDHDDDDERRRSRSLPTPPPPPREDGTAPMRSNEPMRLGSMDIVGLRRGKNPLDIATVPAS